MSYYLILCGLGIAGAIAYGIPVFLKEISAKPPNKYAVVNLLLCIFVGAIASGVLTGIIGHHFPWTIQPEPYALAFIIGLAINPNIPLIQKLVSGFADAFKDRRG